MMLLEVAQKTPSRNFSGKEQTLMQVTATGGRLFMMLLEVAQKAPSRNFSGEERTLTQITKTDKHLFTMLFKLARKVISCNCYHQDLWAWLKIKGILSGKD